MYLFDDKGNVTVKNIEDIVCIKRDSESRMNLFCGENIWFHDANTLESLIQLYGTKGFRQIDKNKLININKVDKYEKGKLWADGTIYTVSRSHKDDISGLFS